MLKFDVNGQTITRIDDVNVVESSENYLQAQFSFSEDWNGVFKSAAFITPDGTVYPAMIQNDGMCDVREEWLHNPMGYVGVLGSDGSKKITSDTVLVIINQTGFTGDELEEESKKYFDEIMAALKSNEDNIELAKRWAIGSDSVPGSETDNAKYYSEQAARSVTKLDGQIPMAKKAIDEYVAQKEHELKGETGDVNFCAFDVNDSGELVMYQNKNPESFSFSLENDNLVFRMERG